MSLSLTTSKNDYVGNGAVDTYAYSFKIFDDDDLVVKVRNLLNVEVTLTKTTDYTVTGVLGATGGNVVLVNAAQAWLDGDGDLKSGYVITIKRHVSLIQSTDLRNSGTYYPEDVEDQFDKQVMIDQQQQEEIDRCVKLPATIDDSAFDPTLPTDIEDLPNALIGVNGDGNGLDLFTISEIAAAVAVLNSAISGAFFNWRRYDITQSQAAADLDNGTEIEEFDGEEYHTVIVRYVIRQTGVNHISGELALHYFDGSWCIIGPEERNSNYGDPNGVQFSLSAQVDGVVTLQAAESGEGDAIVDISTHLVPA